MNENVQYRTAKSWQIHLWPLSAGVINGFGLLMMYVSYITAGGYGIAVAVSGMILTGTRIFDGITDPICAFVSDRINTKFGKVRILCWLGWLIMALATLVMFVFAAGKGHGAVFFTINYMVYVIGYTMINVAVNIGNATITNDPKQRPLLSRWSTVYTMIAMMGGSMALMMFVLPRFNNEFSLPMLAATCVIIIVVTAILLLIASLAISSVDKPENFTTSAQKGSKIDIKDCVEVVKHNRPLQMFIVAAASDKLALQTAGNTAFSTLLFGILIGNMGMSAVMSALTMPLSLLGAILAPRMAIRKGNKVALTWFTWFAIIASAAGIVLYMFLDFRSIFVSAVPTALFMAFTVLKGIGSNGASACNIAMLADVSDYEISRSGNVMPGTVAACYSFLDKIISSLATTLAGFSLAAIGYTNVMPQPTDPQTPAILPMVIVMTIVVPMIGWLCTIVAMKFYPLTKEKMVEVQQKNSELRAAQGTK